MARIERGLAAADLARRQLDAEAGLAQQRLRVADRIGEDEVAETGRKQLHDVAHIRDSSHAVPRHPQNGRMTRKERLGARILAWGLLAAGVCIVLASADSLIGGGGTARIIRLVAGLVLLGEGLALTMDGARPWVPPGRRLVKQLVLERFYGNAETLGGRLLTGTIRVVIGQLLFVLGLVLVGFGALELTRVP